MEFINELSSKINNLINSNKHLVITSEAINVKAFEKREQTINQFSDMLNTLSDISVNIENFLTLAKNTHSEEISAMNSLFSKIDKKRVINEPEWKVVVRKKAPSVVNKCGKSTLQNAKVDKPIVTRVKFTEALSLPAIKVPTFDYVKQDGELYYVDCADHFAIMIGGKLLHGNIGTIYTDERSPEKIKDCKFALNCMKRDKCDYYHNPVKFHGSHDHRNYIASSWLYAPANSQYNRPRSRRFGSREHLDTDIVGLQPEEILRFHDQAMHDLLCVLLLDDSYRQK